MTHTVEKIGGTSMSRYKDVLNNIWLQEKNGSPYNRIFVVSAYAGVTDMLLEHKKTGDAGVYSSFIEAEEKNAWLERLEQVHQYLRNINADMFSDQLMEEANTFIDVRIDDVKECMTSLQNLCSYGHFQLKQHLSTVREMLASIGEAHSAFNSVLLLRSEGINARFVDLTGWKQEAVLPINELIEQVFADNTCAEELLIVTGYTNCAEKLMQTFDRGYSEMTFSKIASITKAREAIIHKEFHLSSADPRIVGEENAVAIGMTNFDVTDQLSNLGMEAIHPKAAQGIRKANINLRVKNTFEPEHHGTIIDNDYCNPKPCVEIIAGRTDVQALEVFDQEMLGSPEHDITISRLVKELKIQLINKEADANSVTFYLSGNRKMINRLVCLIEEKFNTADVKLYTVALVSAIGSDLAVKGILSKTVSSLTAANIDILSLHQTMRQVEMQCVVAEDDYGKAIKSLHQALVESENHGSVIRTVAA